METERRAFLVRELRVAGGEAAEPPKIAGYAALFDALSEDLGGFVEQIAPGAFARTLRDGDARALWNHDANYPLGRVSAGTLRMAEDVLGLSFEIDPPDTSWARDLMVSLQRGDVREMSFGFYVKEDTWEQVGDQIVRTLRDVDLLDVSPVTFPAYPQTSAQVRARVDELRAASSQETEAAARARAAAQARRAARRRRVEIEEKI